MKRTTVAVATLAVLQCGCIVVGGYTSRGGWFVWPGGFGLLLIILLLYLFFGRR